MRKRRELRRLSLGIPGLDALIQGGVPFHSVVVVCGMPGAGKTTFSIQAAMNLINRGGKVAYITAITEPISLIIEFASTYAFFDPDKFTKNTEFFNVAEILKKSGDLMEVMDTIVTEVYKGRFELIIIDPVTIMRDYIDPLEYRRIMDGFLSKLRLANAVTLMTGEILENEIAKAPETYLGDGIIMLSNLLEIPIRRRYIEVVKMRGTVHSNSMHSIVINDNGINVQSMSL